MTPRRVREFCLLQFGYRSIGKASSVPVRVGAFLHTGWVADDSRLQHRLRRV